MPGWTPPKKSTVILSLLVVIIGIILGILGFLNLIPLVGGKDYNRVLVYVGFGLTFLSWIILFLGVRLENF